MRLPTVMSVSTVVLSFSRSVLATLPTCKVLLVSTKKGCVGGASAASCEGECIVSETVYTVPQIRDESLALTIEVMLQLPLAQYVLLHRTDDTTCKQ